MNRMRPRLRAVVVTGLMDHPPVPVRMLSEDQFCMSVEFCMVSLSLLSQVVSGRGSTCTGVYTVQKGHGCHSRSFMNMRCGQALSSSRTSPGPSHEGARRGTGC
jgi:hypothetical protein